MANADSDGQPILVLTDQTSSNRFASYVLEILDVEGIFVYDVKDLSVSTLSEGDLVPYDIVILTNIEISSEQQACLSGYAHGGGNLIGLRPPGEMRGLFGLLFASESDESNYEGIYSGVSDRYIRIEPQHPLARDVCAETLQFHGTADLYVSDRADVLAYVSGDFEGRSGHVGVSTFQIGTGHTAAFAYDLAASTVLFHQGRRENSSIGSNPDPDGDDRWIPNDFFVDYLDTRLKYVPQADIHQDLLVRILNWMGDFHRPIPRAWYFPNAVPGIAYFNGDSDSMNREDYMNVVSTLEKYGGKYTVYLLEEHYKVVPPPMEKELRAKGHCFGQHVELDWLVGVEDAKARVSQELEQFLETYGYAPMTNRCHCLIWAGWTEMAKFLSAGGVRMDQNFIPRRFYRHGYLNGSGLPVKFMDEEGSLLNIYEQNTHITDDGSVDDLKFLVAGYSQEEVLQVAFEMLDDCVDRYHGVFQPSFHPSLTTELAMWLLEGLAQRCWKRDIPMVGGDEWVRFNDARREMTATKLAYDSESGRLAFVLSSNSPMEGITWMLPARFDGHPLKAVRVDGEEHRWSWSWLKGAPYGLVVLDMAENDSKIVEADYE